MKAHLPKNQLDSIWKDLVNKFQADPQGFRAYFPEVARALEELLASREKAGFTSALTDLERKRLSEALLQLLKAKKLSTSEAIQSLEYCATLVQDESLPEVIERKTIMDLLCQVIGAPVSKIKRNTRIPVREGQVTKEIAILRGVYLELTWNDSLVAISISPARLKERSKALKFVGMASDSASDVSRRHDDYLSRVY